MVHPHIRHGFVYGAITGLGYALFRFKHDVPAGFEGYLWIASYAVLGVVFVGAVGAAVGFVLAFGQAAYRRLTQGRSNVVRD